MAAHSLEADEPQGALSDGTGPHTKQWEQSTAYFLNKHNAVHAFVKNARLGFGIPYLHNGRRAGIDRATDDIGRNALCAGEVLDKRGVPPPAGKADHFR